ncbi:MAG TPA: GNAT family N-acetyltransferase [Longimicrobiales bacterium]
MSPGGFVIRPLDDYAELKRAVDLQRLIWGADFDEVVPPAVLWFARRIGGIVAGAFDGTQMIGLLFGVTGWDGQRPIHWSDMLGVHPAARGRGVGLALKTWQRDRLLEHGVTTVKWTFDPLESRNAWLNFRRLGVTSREYLRDAYGASTSPLHRGIGTDRLVVDWQLSSDRVRSRMEGMVPPVTAHTGGVPVINPEGEPPRLELDAERVWLRIPADIQSLKARDEVAARRWRYGTRAAFEAYFGRGYEASDVARDPDGSRYLLVRN